MSYTLDENNGDIIIKGWEQGQETFSQYYNA